MRTRALPVSGGERGFTLLETMVAMAILAVGILTACLMQGMALRTSTVAYQRTEANNVAQALVEALQQLPFDHAMLEPTQSDAALDMLEKEGVAAKWTGSLDKSAARVLTRDADDKLAEMVSGVFTVKNDEGAVMDARGLTFDLRWAVQEVVVKAAPENISTDKIIRVYMDWDTPVGIKNHLQYTTNKYSGEN